MSTPTLPLWVTIPGTILLVLGGLASVVGSVGLLRLRDFFSRMHGPSMTNTTGAGAILITSMLASSAITGRPVMHELVLALFALMSAPLTSIMLVQAALYRDKARKNGKAAADNDSQ